MQSIKRAATALCLAAMAAWPLAVGAEETPSPGWRTTGTQAGQFLVTPSGWTGTVPDGLVRIGAPTPYVWIISRTKTDGPADYDAVHRIQAGYKVTPLSRWGKAPAPGRVEIDPEVDMKTPPKTQVDTMPADKYFTYAAELLKAMPPHVTDQPIIARMRRIGIVPGQSLGFDKLDSMCGCCCTRRYVCP